MLFSSWTYTSDIDDPNCGSLILYDPNIKLPQIMSLLSNSFKTNIVVLVTATPEIYSHLNIFTYTYFDIFNIKSLLVNYNIELIIFDSVTNLSSLTSSCNFDNVYCKIIILSTWGDEITDLQFILEHIPNLKLLNFCSKDFKPILVDSIKNLDINISHHAQNIVYSNGTGYNNHQKELIMNTFSKGSISVDFIPTIKCAALHIINFVNMQDIVKMSKISKNIYIYLDDIDNINKIKYYNDAYTDISQGSDCVYAFEEDLLISN